MKKFKIKSLDGNILFEHEKENNTIKETVSKAVLNGTDLRGAYLRGADLRGAYLRGAYLRGAYLRGADLSGADLNGADLSGADLSGADLSGAYLKNKKIKKAAIFTGIYTYVCIPFITEDDDEYISLGCYTRKVSEWESDFWNNDCEFSNDGSLKSKLRLLAFETAKKWLEIVKKS